MARTRGRRAYTIVAEDDDRDIESQESHAGDSVPGTEEEPGLEDNNSNQVKDETCSDGDDERRIKLVVMDPAQNKFDVAANPSWNVAHLKKEGFNVHKIPGVQQRLIFMGRLLSDDTILADAKINKDGMIIHLFPKPRVVVQGNNCESGSETVSNEESVGINGAHVPEIVLDPDEAEMRSSILVLGSAEILEAQNNVKLLSFLLLLVTSMELLALFTLLLGVPQDVPTNDHTDDSVPTDDIIHNHSTEIRSWRNSDYFDMALNLFGFYSAMLGIKATTENTRRLAFRYLLCTVVCGFFWNAFYYYINYEGVKEFDHEQHKYHKDQPLHTTEDYMKKAFIAITIQIAIWAMCCMKAYQFHQLLAEAELEAEARIQSELNMQEEDIEAENEN
mmetsp:Transcript_11207/g.17329  ORF Transcript_11207/g.17329 Transcript_11207/m.17329 type:complete len:390 (+) Transcript_11207:305-1474(+)|eukprot:CAMPEP_0178915472 /NCGR_PEP_ID=MMETSP0786-20121207/12045_1 /TAXON_ID=186022 /ORGANISM="Thalassionema frauenfeldii, Strain CCMP 1798" /LENGTH=389 /DNA_ID=CAMNT_0020588585 /DNA_START=200 /DNA_END=1369 /DNA_ORIENTATION=+